MGNVPKNDPVRDQNLIDDYLATNEDGSYKYPISALGLKYARKVEGVKVPLSSSRIYQIINKYGIDKNRAVERKKTDK